MNCIHNQRSRYTSGYYCRDCRVFFDANSPTYRSGELLDSIWMVLNNINAERVRAKEPKIKEVADLKEEIGIGLKHKNYEDIIQRAEIVMSKYGKNSESAVVMIG